MSELAIIGGGPAGLTAAIYALRAGHTVTVYEKESLGGQITASPLVENYPGVPGVSGAELGARMAEQAEALGAEIRYREVLGISRAESGFVLKTAREEDTARAVILATGVTHRGLGLPGEEELIGAGISFCAVCDGAFYRDGTVAVVGGGDSALQEALYLSTLCRKVCLIHRRSQFRAEERLVAKARAAANIEMILESTPSAYLSRDGELTGLVLTHKPDGAVRELPVDGLFLAVGQTPANAFLQDLVAMTPEGYLYSDETALTSVPGIFAAGDCRTKEIRQLTTAVSDGAVAALAASDYLERL